VLLGPGRRFADEHTAAGRVITMPGVRVPWTGGYRVMLRRRPLRALLENLRPDRLEVSDRFTLRLTGRWARSRSIRSMMVSHESVDGLLGVLGFPRGVGRALEEFSRLGVRNWSACRSGSTLTSSIPASGTRAYADGRPGAPGPLWSAVGREAAGPLDRRTGHGPLRGLLVLRRGAGIRGRDPTSRAGRRSPLARRSLASTISA
jgi:hypothetical protein